MIASGEPLWLLLLIGLLRRAQRPYHFVAADTSEMGSIAGVVDSRGESLSNYGSFGRGLFGVGLFGNQR
jgi:hypothetical protein